MQELFVIGNIRKHDKMVFLPEGRLGEKKQYYSLEEAENEVARRAKNNSKDYLYVVFKVTPVIIAESIDMPVKITYL